MAMSIPVILTIGLVMTLVVGNQVLQRETIVVTEEIDARVNGTRYNRNTSTQASRRVAKSAIRPMSPRPEGAHRVMRAIVGLFPWQRLAKAITKRPNIPRFGNQLGLADDRILHDGFEETTARVKFVAFPNGSVTARSKRKPSTCISVNQ